MTFDKYRAKNANAKTRILHLQKLIAKVCFCLIYRLPCQNCQLEVINKTPIKLRQQQAQQTELQSLKLCLVFTQIKPDLLNLRRIRLGLIIQFITGHKWLLRHKIYYLKKYPNGPNMQTLQKRKYIHIWLECTKLKEIRNKVQRVLALCEFHQCEFHYCDFSKLSKNIWLMRFYMYLCTCNSDMQIKI